MNKPELKYSRVDKLIERAFVVVFGVLFVYAVVAWFQVVPDGETKRPLGFVCLTGAMLLQPVAVLVRSRSRAAFWTMLLVSTGLLGVSFALVAS